MSVWWQLRTEKESLLFDDDMRAALRVLNGSRIVDLHDHDDGTACLLIRGPLAESYLANPDIAPSMHPAERADVRAALREEEARHV